MVRCVVILTYDAGGIHGLEDSFLLAFGWVRRVAVVGWWE